VSRPRRAGYRDGWGSEHEVARGAECSSSSRAQVSRGVRLALAMLGKQHSTDVPTLLLVRSSERRLTRYADLWDLRLATSTTASTNRAPTRRPPAKPTSATMSVTDGPTR
jgi:hypothetical protein